MDTAEAIKDGVYRTPQAAIDAVLANPPMSEPTAGTGSLPPLDLPPGADGVEPGENPFTACSLADLPGIGVEFQQFHTDKYFKFLCWWHNAEDKVGHVYEVTVEPCCSVFHGNASLWRTRAQSDGKEIFVMESRSKRISIECGLAAMRRYLVRGHRAAWRTWRKSCKAQSTAQEVQA